MCAEHEEVVAEYAATMLQQVRQRGVSQQHACQSLSIAELLKLSKTHQRLILRQWFKENHLRMPNERHLRQIQKDVINAAPDAHPVFTLPDMTLYRKKGWLLLGKPF